MSAIEGAQRRRWARLGSAAFLLAGPGTVAGLVPWLLTGWKIRKPVRGGPPAQVLGVALIAAGGALVVDSFARFAREGLGTPVPAAPPTNLVVGGPYRHVRNPMYVALEALIAGQALLFGQPRVWAYCLGAAIPPVAFVRFYEEPHLARTFGAEYEEYRNHVPAWAPRLRPWCPSGQCAD